MPNLRPRSVPGPDPGLAAPYWGRALLAGGLLGVSVLPWGLGWIALGAWVPLLVPWQATGTPQRGLVNALTMGLVAGAVAFGWGLRHPFLPSALAAVGAILLWALTLALPWAGGATLAQRGRRGRAWIVLIAGTLGLEAVWSVGPWALPWGLLGHTLAEVPVLSSLAAAWGVPGLSALVLLSNAFLTEACRMLPLRPADVSARGGGARGGGMRCAVLGILAGGLLLHATLLHVRVLNRSQPPPASEGPVLFLVQPGTPPEAWSRLADTSRVADLRALTAAALDTAAVRPDLVVWPETALPPVPHDAVMHRLQRWVDRRGVPLLTGAIAPVPEAAGPEAAGPEAAGPEAAGPEAAGPYRHANRLALLAPRQPPQHYDKHHLVPFVERVPGIRTWPALASLVISGGGVPGYRRGPGPNLLSAGTLRIAPLICLESVVGPYVRRYMAQTPHPDVLVTASHTGWWSSPRPARQHLAFSRLRSVETGRPLALVTVRGPTALISSTGRVARRLSWGARGVLRAPLSAPVAPPVFFGLPPVWRLWLFGLLAVLAGIPTAGFRNSPSHLVRYMFIF